MYENYTKQALPSDEYRELIGSAVCAFNSNKGFIIENILKKDVDKAYTWYELIETPAGGLREPIQETITKHSDESISSLFYEIVKMRNKIINSVQVTSDGEQKLLAFEEDRTQFVITKEYLLDFINLNEELSTKLHDFRGN
ncbi:selenium binding protein [Bacillus mesophilum]|uniref:Selenium binding protein n=1 Tax=Bacillus mesophilum TaxID=1071718 RepID=A0A7V7RI17_9BACI|nr:selenium binding protein [Bacillus mesophilum]KAB2329421.1 selenium binding protein [Bacillus mesophilum]